MKNKIILTVTDKDGSKSFHFDKRVKKWALYTLIVSSVLFIISFSTTIYLKSELSIISEKKNILSAELDSLSSINRSLNNEISLKTSDLNAITDKISDIEEMMGLKTPDSLKLHDRVELAKMTTLQKAYALKMIPSGSPIEYRRISSSYGKRKDPFDNTKEFHRGIDLSAKTGTPIYATADGVIEYSGYHKRSGYGHLIMINHNFGFKTSFAHMNKRIVRTGDSIKKGDLIGYSGNSGRSNGPHLHYEVRFVNMILNPKNFMDWEFKNFEEIFAKEKKVKWAPLLDLLNLQIEFIEHQLYEPELALLTD